MRPLLRSLALIFAVVLVGATMTRCGDDDDPPATPVATAAADGSATAADDESATGDEELPGAPAPTSPDAPLADPPVTPVEQPTATPTLPPAPTATPPPPTAVPVADIPVNVYWAWTVPTAPVNREVLGAGGRSVARPGVAAGALAALLAGPDIVETEIGMSSAIPAGTQLVGVALADGVATVDLNAAFEEPGGTLGETLRFGQVVFTLTQFDSVDTVRFRIDGQDRDVLGSHGLDVSGGVDRDDFANVRAAITVERPVPGADLSSPALISGEANTFEANVQYVLTDADGLIIAEGFTTATAGNGTWGRFEVSVPFPTAPGRGAVIVFETSAATGDQINVVEYPVTLS